MFERNVLIDICILWVAGSQAWMPTRLATLVKREKVKVVEA